jgi:hypothetical protein
MNILAAIKREQRKLEKQIGKMQGRLDGLRVAANTLATSANHEMAGVRKRVLSADAREKISRAAKRRWAKVRVGAKKAVS